jgi:hypothetical protein
MPRITNKGKKVRMVADEILHPGDSKYVTATKAREYEGDSDLVIDEVGPWKPETSQATQTPAAPRLREVKPKPAKKTRKPRKT